MKGSPQVLILEGIYRTGSTPGELAVGHRDDPAPQALVGSVGRGADVRTPRRAGLAAVAGTKLRFPQPNRPRNRRW